jgi:hypothetical protein
VRLVLVEMTAGAGLVTGMLLLAIAVAGALAMTPPAGGPSWSTPFNLALTGLVVIAPVCAGAVAWLVRDYRVRGIGALAASSNRGAAGGALPRVAAPCAWAALAYLVLLTAATLRTAHRGPPAGPPLLLALLAGCFLATCAALGWAIGTLSDLRVAGPLLALALFGLVRLGAAGGGWARPLAPVNPEQTYRPFLQPHVRLVWVQVAVLVAVTVLGLSAVLAGRPRRLTGLAGAVVLAGAVLTLSRTDPALTEIRGAPAHPVCAHGPVTVCLRPENADLLPGSEQALAEASAALAPYLPVPTRFSEPGIDRRVASGPGIYVPPARADRLAFRAAALAAIVPLPCPPRRIRPGTATLAYGDVLTWAAARVGGRTALPPYGLDRVAPVLGMDPDRQRSWVRHHLAASCAR